MAKIAVRRLFVEAAVQPTDVVGYKWYYGDPSVDLPTLAVNSQRPYFQTTARQLLIGDMGPAGGGVDLPEGNYQFGVVAVDGAGNESDMYQHPDWLNVDMDVTPPDPPTGGGIELFGA